MYPNGPQGVRDDREEVHGESHEAASWAARRDDCWVFEAQEEAQEEPLTQQLQWATVNHHLRHKHMQRTEQQDNALNTKLPQHLQPLMQCPPVFLSDVCHITSLKPPQHHSEVLGGGGRGTTFTAAQRIYASRGGAGSRLTMIGDRRETVSDQAARLLAQVQCRFVEWFVC